MCDVLVKVIYNVLFDWIVECINMFFKVKQVIINSIGILDIYGFEIFEKNSFEQLCINYVNEKLQQIFIQFIFKIEQEEYVREQIQWILIKYFDNKVVCDFIEQIRLFGVFLVMKDVIKMVYVDFVVCDCIFM